MYFCIASPIQIHIRKYKMRPLFQWKPTLLWALVWNILLVYLLSFICRLLFITVNYDIYAADFSWALFFSMMRGGVLFDTSAICYLNALYLVLLLLPLAVKERKGYYLGIKILFVVVNSLGIVANLVDSVYFQFSGRRSTASVFHEFSHEDNMGQIFGNAILHYWYLTLAGIVLIALLWLLYWNPVIPKVKKPRWRYYVVYGASLLAIAPFVVFGIRGGIGRDIRPITLSNANNYVDKPVQAAAVLNTPFSIIRTLSHKTFVDPHYFSTDEMSAIYSPIHIPSDTLKVRKKNVVIFILESFAKENFGSLNPTLEGGRYKGYTPFMDSLITQSLTFEYSYCNGRKSIDAMPSVLSSIPMFIEPYFLTQVSLNKVTSVASELNKEGYYTAFFHGAPNGSMGFQAFARTSGFKDYYGKDEYVKDPRFGGEKDFDGYWAIWDEEFFQYFCLTMSSFKEPFATSIFSATSHHPFQIPARYKGKFAEGDRPIRKCIRYTDYALRHFFETASKQPWFKNTIFVFTADHTNQKSHAEYETDAGLFSVPIIFYDPSGEMPRGLSTTIAQQIDIMPTVLDYLGYKKPYVAFGIDLLNSPQEKGYAVNYNNGIYQYFKGEYMLQFDGQKSVALYEFKQDVLLKNNLLGKVPQEKQMERELKAIIQQYMQRMINDKLTVQ